MGVGAGAIFQERGVGRTFVEARRLYSFGGFFSQAISKRGNRGLGGKNRRCGVAVFDGCQWDGPHRRRKSFREKRGKLGMWSAAGAGVSGETA